MATGDAVRTVWVKVEGDTVVNRAVFDDDGPQEDLPDRAAWRQATAEMQIGAIFDGGRWLPPPEPERPPVEPSPMDELKAEVEALRSDLSALSAEIEELKLRLQ